jgi:hypothetical protein
MGTTLANSEAPGAATASPGASRGTHAGVTHDTAATLMMTSGSIASAALGPPPSRREMRQASCGDEAEVCKEHPHGCVVARARRLGGGQRS